MRGENVSAEMKANVLIEHRRHKKGALKVANKFGLDQSTVTRIFQKHREAVGDEPAQISSNNFQKIEMPDENLQSGEEKIAFYKSEAEKYKAAALAIEKKLGFLLQERTFLRANEIENVLKNHEETEVDGKWKMSHEEFLDFFSSFGAT